MSKVSGIDKISFWSNELHLSRRDPPTAPDGLYDWQAGEDADENPQADSFLTNLFKEVGSIIKKNRTAPHPQHIVRHIPFIFRITTQDSQAGFVDLALHPTNQDDRLGAVWSHFFL
jgi:linoleate 10R-lipoxygenase